MAAIADRLNRGVTFRFFEQLSLARQILFAFAIVMAILIGSALYIAAALNVLDAKATEQQRITRAAEAAYLLDVEASRVTLLLEQYGETRDPGKLEEMLDNRRQEEMHRNSLRTFSRLPKVFDALSGYEAILPQRIRSADKIIAAIRRNAPPEEITPYHHERNHLDEIARIYLRSIAEAENAELDRALNDDFAYRKRTKQNIVIALSIAIASIVSVSLLFARRLRSRLTSLNEMATVVGRGNLSARVYVGGSDEIGKLAAAFNTMAAELDELDKVKDEFLALASHQLRTPATSVKANLGMLLEGYFGDIPSDQKEVIDDAYQSNERQLTVIDDLLNVARTDAGRVVLTRCSTDVLRVIEEVIGEQQPIIQSRKQRIAFIRPDEPLNMMLDAQRMVLENLVSNASKYTPEGGDIRVSIENVDKVVQISVSDTGFGIAHAELSKLFKKFSRLDNPHSVKMGGTGLGLYLARQIVRMHGGEISVSSIVGEGSTFTIMLPNEEARDG
jgi:signal transduction histidine kinase